MCEKIPELIGGMDGLQKVHVIHCRLKLLCARGGVCTGNHKRKI